MINNLKFFYYSNIVFPSIIKKEGLWKRYIKRVGIEESELDGCCAAIKKYSVAYYNDFNNLSVDKYCPSDTEFYVLALDKSIEIWKRCIKNIKDFSFYTNRKFVLKREEYEILKTKWLEKGYIEHNGFISTSTRSSFNCRKGINNITINLDIFVNSLSKGIFIKRISETPQENEFIIKRGELIYIDEFNEIGNEVNIKGRTI